MDVKGVVDDALKSSQCVENVLTIKRTGSDVSMESGRDVWYHNQKNLVDDYCPPEEMHSEDLLFILYGKEFPVDSGHQAKIRREELSHWLSEK